MVITTRDQLRSELNAVYQFLVKNNRTLLDKYLPRVRRERKEWTEELIIAELQALQVTSCKEWDELSPQTRKAAGRLKLTTSIRQKLGIAGYRIKRYSYMEALSIAKQYTSLSQWRASCSGSYSSAVSSKWTRRISAELGWKSKGSGIIKWTKVDNIKKEALNYMTRTAFSKGSPGAYQAAKKRGVLDIVCAHIPLSM